MIKITSGFLKNHNINITDKVLDENEVRRTSNYTKQLIMNLIKNSNAISSTFTFSNSIVADICCGSGAIGFEMLSNDAKMCYFFDNNTKLLKTIDENIDKFKLKEKAKCINNITKLKDIDQKIDFIFIDPPYPEQERIITNFISIASKSKAITSETIILLECKDNISNIIEAKENAKCRMIKKATSSTFLISFNITKSTIPENE